MMSASPWPLFAFAALLGGAAYKELSTFGGLEKTGFPFAPLVLLVIFVLYGTAAPGISPVTALVALSIFGLLIAPSYVNKPSKSLLELASCWCICPLLVLGVLQ